jgi:large subunit ribosomal protein LX
LVRASPYRIEGEVRKRGEVTPFSREVMAVKPEDALELIYSEMGSRHRAKRREISITSVKELKPEEISDSFIAKLRELEVSKR